MKKLIVALAAASFAFGAMPAAAQEEESRTTWNVSMIQLTDGAGTRWEDIFMEHLQPAYEAAGLPVPQIQWVMVNNDWDYVIVSQVPGGMATFDHHRPEARMALWNALVAQEGSEDAANALFAEMDALEENVMSVFTHSHP